MGYGVPHDEPVHSATPLPPPLFSPTAQHNVVDGHDMPRKKYVPDMEYGVPQPPDAVHSTVSPPYPTAQHNVVDGHDMPNNTLVDSGITDGVLSVPLTPLGAGMVASLTVMPDDGVDTVPENAPQDSPGMISAAASSIPIKNMPTRLAARQKTWLPVCLMLSPLLINSA
jgi:hypothetical protein